MEGRKPNQSSQIGARPCGCALHDQVVAHLLCSLRINRRPSSGRKFDRSHKNPAGNMRGWLGGPALVLSTSAVSTNCAGPSSATPSHTVTGTAAFTLAPSPGGEELRTHWIVRSSCLLLLRTRQRDSLRDIRGEARPQRRAP